MKHKTKVTAKGASTIPGDLRKLAGISPGAVLAREFCDYGVFARPKAGTQNLMQKHIRARAGAWQRKISGVELLRRTRP